MLLPAAWIGCLGRGAANAMTELRESDAASGGGEKPWTQERFDNLDQHRDVLRRARPDLAWKSNQLAQGRVHGSVMSCRSGAVAVTCSSVSGSFEMRGPASTQNLVLSLSLEAPVPGMQWMRPTGVGMVGIYLPNRDVDTINRGNVSFAVIDIPHAELELRAARLGINIDPAKIARSGVLPGRVAAAPRAWLSRLVAARHRGRPRQLPPGYQLDEMIVAATLALLDRTPSDEDPMRLGGYHRIVARARSYIEAHLDGPIVIDSLVVASFASRRTLFRAFAETLGETPQSYILKLRLNRIRHDLAGPNEAMRTVTVVSNQWGIPELGRLAGRYREQFGELPRDTLARRGLAQQGLAHPIHAA
jgi:AraC-like DNA-binding protein